MWQDSLIDIATSLGVPADKIILRIPAFGKYFELEDELMNTPGSPVNGKQEYLTHQQVGIELRYVTKALYNTTATFWPTFNKYLMKLFQGYLTLHLKLPHIHVKQFSNPATLILSFHFYLRVL